MNWARTPKKCSSLHHADTTYDYPNHVNTCLLLLVEDTLTFCLVMHENAQKEVLR